MMEVDLGEEEEELPVVALSRAGAASAGGAGRHSFELLMPDARELAAQRKVEYDIQAELEKYEKEEPLPIIEDQILSEVQIPPTQKTKAKSVENPGIVLDRLNKMEVVSMFDGPMAVFLSDLLDQKEDFKENLSWLTESIVTSLSHDKANFTPECVWCLVLACSLILLDEKCKNNVNACHVRQLVAELLNEGGDHQNERFLTSLAEHLLRIITNCHDRLILAQSFEHSYIDPENILDPRNFSNRLAMTLAHETLKQILGFKNGELLIESFNLTHLKDLVVDSASWKELGSQEQYSALMLLNMLKKYAIKDANLDATAVEEVLKFLAKIKFHDFKVRMLVTKMNLFWKVRDKENEGKGRKEKEIKDISISE